MKHSQHDLLDQCTFSVQFWALIVDSLCTVGALLAFSNEILLIYIKNKKNSLAYSVGLGPEVRIAKNYLQVL